MKSGQISILIFSILLLSLESCLVQKQNSSISYNVDTYSEYYEFKEPFEITVLEHIKGCECGTRSCASITIGLTANGDTVRVLMLCNTRNFQQNTNLKIQPQEKPTFQVSVYPYWIEGDKEVNIPEIHKKKLRTTYGKIIE